MILSLPKDDYKTKTRPDLNIVDEQWGWTPLITAMNQGPKGFLPGINALLRAGADPYKEIPSDRDERELYTAAQWAAQLNQVETLQAIRLHAGSEALFKVNDSGNIMHAACDAEDNAIETVNFLLTEKIDLNVKNKQG